MLSYITKSSFYHDYAPYFNSDKRCHKTLEAAITFRITGRLLLRYTTRATY